MPEDLQKQLISLERISLSKISSFALQKSSDEEAYERVRQASQLTADVLENVAKISINQLVEAEALAKALHEDMDKYELISILP